MAKAEEHIKLWKNTEVLVPDPFRQELDLALESGLSYELRGVRALEQRDFPAAEGFFKKGVAITPGTTGLGRSLRHKLATALYMQGDVRGAMTWFEETIKMAPPAGIDETAAKAHYSLGVLMASSGRGQEAISHLSAAVRFSPNYVEAYQALADALRRSGKAEQSLTQYNEALRVNPKSADARFGYGMALVRLGRYREARDWFDDASRINPDRLGVPIRTGATAGGGTGRSVRDGARAQAIVERLLQGGKTIDLGETMAMALAERGQFAEAVGIQRSLIEAAIRSGLEPVAKRTDRKSAALRAPAAMPDAVGQRRPDPLARTTQSTRVFSRPRQRPPRSKSPSTVRAGLIQTLLSVNRLDQDSLVCCVDDHFHFSSSRMNRSRVPPTRDDAPREVSA